MADEFILTECCDEVALITLNRPEKLNALSFGLVRELDEALTAYEKDDAVKAVILTGAGERAFSAGADIHEMAGLSSEELAQRQAFRSEATWHVATFAKPLIGAINGLAYGGAALLSSTLDLRIGCERTQFRFLAASYGRVNSTWSLPLLVGLPKAKELLYTGRVVGAEEALRIGLLNEIVPSARLVETAIEIAQAIAKNDARMVQGIKRLLHEEIGLGWRERYATEEDARATWLRRAGQRQRRWTERPKRALGAEVMASGGCCRGGGPGRDRFPGSKSGKRPLPARWKPLPRTPSPLLSTRIGVIGGDVAGDGDAVKAESRTEAPVPRTGPDNSAGLARDRRPQPWHQFTRQAPLRRAADRSGACPSARHCDRPARQRALRKQIPKLRRTVRRVSKIHRQSRQNWRLPPPWLNPLPRQ